MKSTITLKTTVTVDIEEVQDLFNSETNMHVTVNFPKLAATLFKGFDTDRLTPYDSVAIAPSSYSPIKFNPTIVAKKVWNDK